MTGTTISGEHNSLFVIFISVLGFDDGAIYRALSF